MNVSQAFSQSLADLVAAASERVVRLSFHRAQSSGFFWRSDTIVTSDEALAEEGDVSVVLPGGEVRSAVVLGRDATTEIALLRVQEAKTPRSVFTETPIRVGARALVVGATVEGPLAAIDLSPPRDRPGCRWRRQNRCAHRTGPAPAPRSPRRRRARRLRPRHRHGEFGPSRRVLVIPTATIERVATFWRARGGSAWISRPRFAARTP